MFEVIFPAIITGILLSLVFIGPVFFLLIETSLTKGHRAAIVLDLGVICADLLCILVAYYGSQDLEGYIKEHPALYRIGGFIIIIYGLFMILAKGNPKIDENQLVTTNYFKTFFNGFLLNLVNVGVVAFWISTVLLIRTQYNNDHLDFVIFMTTTLGTFIAIDMCKIFLAQKFKVYLTDKLVRKIKKYMGMILIVFGIIFFLKSTNNKLIKEIDKDIKNTMPLNTTNH